MTKQDEEELERLENEFINIRRGYGPKISTSMFIGITCILAVVFMGMFFGLALYMDHASSFAISISVIIVILILFVLKDITGTQSRNVDLSTTNMKIDYLRHKITTERMHEVFEDKRPQSDSNRQPSA